MAELSFEWIVKNEIQLVKNIREADQYSIDMTYSPDCSSSRCQANPPLTSTWTRWIVYCQRRCHTIAICC